MNLNKKQWLLQTTFGIRARINTNPDFQRPAVWGSAQKQLLIDTIIRDYDVPKLYWRKIASHPDRYDVVDGQQRLRAIWEFFEDKVKLPKDAEPVEGVPVAGCTYSTLPDELRIRCDVYPMDVVVLEDTDEDEVREMFLRLQNGTSLKAQEKRNAYPGAMRNFVHELVSHPIFSRVGFANARLNYDLVAAQIVRLELAGGPVNVKNTDLNKMYVENKDFDPKAPVAKAVQRTLSLLSEIFPDKTPELERFNLVSVYCVLSELLRQYVLEDFKPIFQAWFLGFEAVRREQEARPEEEADAEWVTYREKISHSTDSSDSIRWRMEFMLRSLLSQHPQIRLKDNQRGFTYVQKLAVFRRDVARCQLKIKCDSAALTWDNWHCDHRVAWSKGGLTTVENGQAACPPCNLSKGAEAAA
ncbi:HNH endonuclease family protein [Candidatus Methylomirabilis limnetica]|nr:DUF262 domain-containing protein [Candidatus Methylomirabilis limnetica]